ncbi:Polysaccharide deacetylase [Salegentibacter echinorum]|uniref:Polysaccharide deacetylase n=1 Tax=Salegentibacter echinorum TaxID=1073325 RepID=A0A1M5FJH7_SALEC|nr:polysaccharide deacetylase family protein [Salegentibacter echinorum]SHF91569.1 Polysaccharide deacetylase [Salegentibacter echinorum]
MNGALIISLDFELLWGVFDNVNYNDKIEYFHNTREVVPKILQLFEKYEISCTWATVGMLFNENWEEWNENIPGTLPGYENKELSAYRFGRSIQNKETESLCFAPNLIRKIQQTSRQEIATHTYSHYYCLEQGQNSDSFKADLKLAVKMAQAFDVELRSLVFPRNQFNREYLEICKNLEIRNVRSNPTNWYWKDTGKDSLLNKIFRTGDAYVGSTNKSYNLEELPNRRNEPLSQKASRLLRPFSPNQTLNSLKIKRIKQEMTKAAKNAEVYHLWWHPHNFGDFPAENLRDLEELLIHYKHLKEEFDFQSLNMQEIEQLFVG